MLLSLTLLTAASVYMIWGFVFHLIADWICQNNWQANNKTDLKHPAAWVHSGIHFLAALLIFPWWGALIVFATHILIDTRKPLIWWGNLIQQITPINCGPEFTPDQNITRKEFQVNTVAMTVAFWRDQVAHVLVLALVSLLVATILK